MAALKYISREKLPEWLKALAAQSRVLVPVEEGGSVREHRQQVAAALLEQPGKVRLGMPLVPA